MSEFVLENNVAVTKIVKEEAMDGAAVDEAVPPPMNAEKRKKKKKSGAFGIFRAALYMLRKKPDEKEAVKAMNKQKSGMDSDGNWKRIVGSMRPLHVQETPQSPMYQMSPATDELGMPMSPAASSSCGTMSQYASALNLRDLDNTDEEEGDPDEVFDAITGDEMIDAKAEEFIAQFYRQIQIQNTARYEHKDRGI